MVHYPNASLENIAVHRVGNALSEEFYVLSENEILLENELLRQLLLHYFLSPYAHSKEAYHLDQTEDNALFNLTASFFKGEMAFLDFSKEAATLLYRTVNHPKTKGGELFVAYFNGLQFEGEEHRAIGLFKVETKENYLKVVPVEQGFDLGFEEEGISTGKLDKACLILDTSEEKGYKVLIAETGPRTAENLFWKDEFLKVRVRNDQFNQTQNVMNICKNFVTQKLEESFEIDSTDKIDLLNRSVKYFKEKDSFNLDEFGEEVIGNEEGFALFKSYKKAYEEEMSAPIADHFELSEAAVKKQAKVFKSILKLDKNFHIYIHGNKELIEKGFDENREMNYYKVYFNAEL